MMNSFMVKMQNSNPIKSKVQKEKYGFSEKLNDICTDKYSSIPNMKSALASVRQNKTTLTKTMVNATSSRLHK